MTIDTSIHTLQDLEPGQSGVIRSVGSDRGAVKRRLVDMGLTPGTTVTVKKIAPFGDPIEVNLRGYEMSLRKEDAAKIVLCAPGEEPHGSRPEDIQPDRETVARMNAAH
jgi:ferrous iron transport protein B